MESIAGKRIALVGGAGFIGHNLALRLNELGARVDVLDGLEVNNLLSYTALPRDTENRELYLKMINQRLDLINEAEIPLHVLDARDYDALSRTLGEIEPEVIIHLAAVAHAGKSNKDPQSTFGHSLRTLENALDYSRVGVRHFIYFSSSMVYGNFLEPEVSEDHPLDPIGIYGALKLAGEKFVIAYQQVFDVPYTIIRPSALYGPRCVSRRVGQVFIEKALVGAKLQIDGEGDERLDFSYVDDVVNGVCLAIAQPESRNQAFNITAGQSRSLQELVTIVQQHFRGGGRAGRAGQAPPLPRHPQDRQGQGAAGYNPQVGLEDGLDRYVSWYRDLTSDGVLAGSASSG